MHVPYRDQPITPAYILSTTVYEIIEHNVSIMGKALSILVKNN